MSKVYPVASSRFPALLVAILLPGSVQAVEGRLGTYFAEGPGAWLQVRHPIAGTDLGIHLAGSLIDLEVNLYKGSKASTDEFGRTTYESSYAPGQVTAMFYEWGLVGSRTVYRADTWNLAISSGLLGGLLDGTMDERPMKPASSMILVPAFLELDSRPFSTWRRLGFTIGAGGVWTIPGDQESLYPEVSPWRWQGRAGVVF
jgi:hypothetical protein